MDHSEKIKRKINPREEANIFSLLTFLYTGKLFSKAFKKDLEEDDLYEVITSCRSKKCGDELEKQFYNKKQRTHPSTVRLLWKCYGARYVVLGLIHLNFKIVSSVLEPQAIGKLVSYFRPNQTVLTIYDAMYYAGIMIGLKLLHCFYFQNYVIYLQQLAIQIRTAFCSLIYRKALKLTPAALLDINLGNIITIITKDVIQFESALWHFNDMWISLIETFVICYLLYAKIGLSSMVGIAVLTSVTPLQAYFGKIIKSMRLNINSKTDQRLQITQETLSAIRIIKMYTWEKFFVNKIDEARKDEVKKIMKAFYLKIVMILTTVLGSKIGFYSLIMTYIWLNNNTSAEVIFYILKCFGTLKHTIAISVSVGMQRIAELSASIQRINNVLDAEELEDIAEKPSDNPKIEMNNVTVSVKDKLILKNITLSLQKGLAVITGPLGCGKSSLIKTILKDYPRNEGTVETVGRKSYASQDPWLFPSSIKQNILFGEAYNEKRYHEVIRVCALRYDFNLLQDGDETIVADRGLNLSKGQQARINLARAVYKESEIYFLDDSLTSLDPHVQDFIFNHCVKGFLENKLVVLVTHNTKHITSADKLIFLEHGTMKFQESERSVTKQILSAIEDINLNEKNVGENERDEVKADETTELLKNDVSIKRRKVYQEVKKEGSVSTEVYSKYFRFGGGICLFGFIVLMFTIAEFTESYSSKILTNWVNIQQNITDLRGTTFINHNGIFSTPSEVMFTNFTATTAELNNSLYANNTILNIDKLESKSNKTLNMYSLMIISFVICELVKSYLILQFARNASVKLHRSMIESIIFSVMSFFDNYFIGNILNRFAQDLSVVDERLPHVLRRMVELLFSVGGIVILIAVVNWKFFIPSLAFIAFLMLLRTIYMPAARSIKRLESATRSPIVGHLNASVEGLTTIRASKAQDVLKNEFDRHQDLYTSAHYTSFCIKRAFGFYMDFCSAMFLTIIIVRFLFFDVDTAVGDVGLAITQAAGLSMIVQRGLMQWSELENLMTSVERVLEYTHLEKESASGHESENFPNKAEINYVNVSLTYSNTNERVLKNISFTVRPKEKIGIIGRTGAGKSSIISTLFRLYNYEGQIFIDGVDIKSLSLEFLRQHISIIPQDPIMFAGTVRSNIDPLTEHTDEEIWKTIHQVHLGSIISSLDLKIADNTSNFSTGQRQLICLARAIIRQNKIVVLDEATANMDPETESLMHEAIVENFSESTVIIIAHRLRSILDCHKVIVMDKGAIVEFDEPLVLMRNKSSMFYKMLNSSDFSDIKNVGNQGEFYV